MFLVILCVCLTSGSTKGRTKGSVIVQLVQVVVIILNGTREGTNRRIEVGQGRRGVCARQLVVAVRRRDDNVEVSLVLADVIGCVDADRIPVEGALHECGCGRVLANVVVGADDGITLDVDVEALAGAIGVALGGAELGIVGVQSIDTPVSSLLSGALLVREGHLVVVRGGSARCSIGVGRECRESLCRIGRGDG